MARRNAQKRDRRTFRTAATLLPIPKSVDADPHGPGEIHLSQPHEAAERGDVVTRLELPLHQASAQARRNRPGQLIVRQLGNVGYRRFSMEE